MSYRDRNDWSNDRNDGRLSGRDDQDWQDQSNHGSHDWDRGERDFARGGNAGRNDGSDLRQHNELRSQGRGFRDEDYGHSRFNNNDNRQTWSQQREPGYAGGAYSGGTGSYSGYRDGRQDLERGRFQERQDWGNARTSGRQVQDWGRDSAQEGYYGGSRGTGTSSYGGSSYGGQAYGGASQPVRFYGSSYGQGNAPSGFRPQNSYGVSRERWEGGNYTPERSYGPSQGVHAFTGSAQRSYEVEGSRGEYRGNHEDSFGQQLRDGASQVVRSVKRAFRGPKGYKRSDERIREDVNDRLASQDQVDPSDIEVQVASGEVTLTGTVQSRHEKFVAEEIADEVSGVNDVHNQLRVRRDNQQAASSSSSPASTIATQNESASRVRNGHA